MANRFRKDYFDKWILQINKAKETYEYIGIFDFNEYTTEDSEYKLIDSQVLDYLRRIE